MDAQFSPRHTLATRVFHGALAVAIITQLASAQFMQVPRDTRPANFAFEVHEYAGMVAFVLALGLWIIVMARGRGTDAGALVPWFSALRRRLLSDDVALVWRDLRRLRLPVHRVESPFVSAVHGLGLLLVSAMATTGTLYYLSGLIGIQKSGPIHLMMEVHTTSSNLVWAYLIGHAGMALIYHFASRFDLRDMWSFGRAPSKGN